MIDEYSVACRQEKPGIYRINWANNGEKLVLKPIQDICMERFTRLVAEAPWYRKREREETSQDWYFLDPEKDRVAGTSLYEAYKFLKFRKSSPITVAVIESPADYSHEDLVDNLWKNPKEIPDNKTDDDNNGFKDDLHGWFFMTTKSGIPVEHEQSGATQICKMWKSRFEAANENALSGQDLKDYRLYKLALKEFEKGKERAELYRTFFSDSLALFGLLNQFLMQSEEPVTEEQIRSWKAEGSPFSTAVKEVLSDMYKLKQTTFDNLTKEIRTRYTSLKRKHSNLWLYDFNMDWNPRAVVVDHPEIPYEKMYGSGKLKNPKAESCQSGTHTAGILGARRANGKGVDGIADNVRIITLGAVPETGDARDKDVANCIRYAADMGAKIITLGFGIEFSPHKKTMDEAIRYAENKGILFFHGAGDQHQNRDSVPCFPIPEYEEGGMVRNWIEVGNCTRLLNEDLVAPSSGFGGKTVHLFAPGTDVFSCLPGNQYGWMSGTGRSTAVAAGIGALIWSYFPSLSASDVKKILLESVYKPSGIKVAKPGTGSRVPFETLSETGGIVNAKSAVFGAEKLLKKKKS
jgi:subtilisin family serine protease